MSLRLEAVIPLEKGRAKIQFDNGVSVILYRGEVRKLSLEEGSFISEEQYRIIMEDIVGKRAVKRAMHLLERQERTESQLYSKLVQGGYPEECIQAAIAYVKSYHYLDDLRYALCYVRYHQEKKSRQKLAVDLSARGVPGDIIEQALEEEYLSDEEEKIAGLLTKRNYDPETADEGEKRRTYQFLMRKGFKSSDVLRVMKQ